MEHFQYTNDEELNLSNKIYFEVNINNKLEHKTSQQTKTIHHTIIYLNNIRFILHIQHNPRLLGL